MAYNRRNFLDKIIKIQDIVLREKAKGHTQKHIYETIIAPQFCISSATFNNYLAINAKKELAGLENDQMNDQMIDQIKEMVHKLYVVEGLSIRETAKRMGIKFCQMDKIVVKFNFKKERFDVKEKRRKKEMYNKEQRLCDKLRYIIEIQDVANQYKGNNLFCVYNDVIRDKYKITYPTFCKYMHLPAKENLSEAIERQRCREIATESRRKVGV